MRLKLQLPAKPGRLSISECEAVRLAILSANKFQALLNAPEQNNCWDVRPNYYEEDGRRIYRGVLILGEGREDGVFAYDKGEHFAYLPGARAIVDSILEQAVEKIVQEGAENTNEGSWCYYFSELDEQMRLVVEKGNGIDVMLLEKLEQRPEVAEVTLTDECFDVCYYIDYCRNLAQKEPLSVLAPDRKEEIISSILDYMAEYFDDGSLYDILHNTLGIKNREIGSLGFALYKEYVDEQTGWGEMGTGAFPMPMEKIRAANLISAYEELHQVMSTERITHQASDDSGYCFVPDVSEAQIYIACQNALSDLEVRDDEFQSDGRFSAREEILSRMRDCLLAKELTAGEKVLFIATEPYGSPDDFALRGGIIESIDVRDKTCSVRGTFFTMEKVPLHYVLGQYNPAIGGEHYGFQGVVPYFNEDKELAGHYLCEVEVMWNAQQEQGQNLSI